MREPAVQGSFYPGNRKELSRLLDSLFKKAGGKEAKTESDIIVSPHAGYAYSGGTAAKAFARLRAHKTFVILAPNHTGYGPSISVYPKGKWKNCLGEAEVDEGLGKALIEKVKEAELDELAHIQEHSAEVMLPFLQHRFKAFKILPVVLSYQDFALSRRLAKAFSELSEEFDFGVIASTDFTHFEPLESAEEKDGRAIELAKDLKAEAFHKLIVEKRMSVCGFVPVEVALELARLKGLKRAELLEYTSSAKATGDKGNVVAYAALAMT